MRTLTTAQTQVRTAGAQADFLRVSVKDSGGTFRDLTTYPGFNAVKSVRWSEAVEDPHMVAEIILFREQHRLSLSPFMSTSALNKGFNPSGGFAALLALNREVKIEVAIMPVDRTPSSGDWFEVFRGRIDTIDAANGANVRLSCRDLGGRLAQQFIKNEHVLAFASVAGVAVPLRLWDPQMQVTVGEYCLPASRGSGDPGENKFFVCSANPTAALTGSQEPVWSTGTAIPDDSDGGEVEWDYVAAPSTGGFAVEQVIQNILTKFKSAGDATVTLYTPTSPSWAIRQFLQGREFVLSAVRKLAQQIGWDVRFKWRAGTSQFEFTLYEPQRSSPSVAYTFTKSEYGDPKKLTIDISQIRNSVRVIYTDRTSLHPDGTPKRKVIEVSDSASIAKYGELWMEIQEDFNSQVDTSTEATRLANAALSDCKEPTAEFSVPLSRGFPWVEVGDYYTFGFNDLHFDASQSLAVTSYTHTFDGKRIFTELAVRGLPTIGASRWTGRSNHPTAISLYEPHRMVTLNGTNTATATLSSEVGGFSASVQETVDKNQLFERDVEIHISRTPGFTPSSLTLKTIVRGAAKTVSDLVPGAPYYVRTVPRHFNAGRIVRGQPSAEKSITAGRAKAGHYDSGSTMSHLPLNGNFEHASDDISLYPPDHWKVVTRPSETTETWGVGGSVFHGTDSSKGRYLELRAVPTQRGNVVSSHFEVRRGLKAANIYLSIMRTGSSASSGKDLIVDVMLYADSALTTLVRSDSIFLSGSASGPYPSLSTWYDTVIDYGGGYGALPTNANFAVIALRRGTAGDNTFAWRIGDVYWQEADFHTASITNGLGMTHVRAKTSTAGSYANGATMVFDTEEYDTLGEFVHTTGIFTCTKAGRYLISATCFTANIAWVQYELFQIGVKKNGTAISYGFRDWAPFSASFFLSGHVTTVANLAVGDTLQVYMTHNRSGGNVSLYADNVANYITIDRLL